MSNYNVFVNDEQVAHLRNKQDAVDIAKRRRLRERAAVRVETERGTVIFEQAAPKRINQSPKYSRVVPLPRGAAPAPKGMRVAYVRPRKGGAILHDATTGKYRIMKLDTGEQLDQEFSTAAQAGDRLTHGV